jgi:predicted HD phosphohydrolase
MDVIERIAELFTLQGQRVHSGPHGEPVTALAHALQCAQLAEWANAEPPLVAAALLHDIGHFDGPLAVTGTRHDLDASGDDFHELRALGWLGQDFGPAVLEPIRLHVQAKRYLVTVDPGYDQRLTAASKQSLWLQGGSMSDDEVAVFEALPGATEAVALRRWDDQAQVPGKRTPPLAYYLTLLDPIRLRHAEPVRTGIGALDIA